MTTRILQSRVLGFYGIGIEHGKSSVNIGTLWRSANLLGAAFIFTVGRRYTPQASDTLKSWRDLPLFNFENVSDLKANLPYDCRLIGVELDAEADRIETFAHPERCVYLLGAEDHGLLRSTIDVCHAMVRLPGERSMNVASAGTVVMYDRLAKQRRAA